MSVQKKKIRIISKPVKKLIRQYTRLAWSLLIGFISYPITKSIFKETPLFNYKYLGEGIIGLIILLVTYFTGANLVKWIGKWLEEVVFKTLNKVLFEFWKVQTARLIEAIKRESLTKTSKANFKLKPVLLDTSAIIDGRIFSVIETGFLDNDIYVSQNVIDELQHMADKKDALKRQKGRLALDKLGGIRKRVGKHRFKVVDLTTKPEYVDKSLVQYCKRHKMKIATVDFNLNKAAQVAGVEVLNINDLANEIKSQFVPGDNLYIKLVQEGKENGQAIGYIEDGTMIVVNNAKDEVGETKQVKVEKVLQTSAGKMVFASLSNKKRA